MRVFLLLSLLVLSPPDLVKSQKHAYQNLLDYDVTVGLGNGITEGPSGDDIAYVTVSDGRLFTIQESSGEVLNVHIPQIAGDCSTVVEWNQNNDDLVVGAYAVGNQLILVDVNGNRIQAFQNPFGMITGQPVVRNDLVFVTSNDAPQNTGFVSIYKLAPSPRIFTQQTIQKAQIGPLSEGSNADYLYFGASTGLMFALNIQTPNENLILVGMVDPPSTGRGHADANSLIVTNAQGLLYWWMEALSGTPDITKSLAPEGNAIGTSLAPVLSRDGSAYYLVAGTSSYAFAANDGTELWKVSSSEVKTQPLIDGGDFVYIVESANGAIIKLDAATGVVEPGYPFTPLCFVPCGESTGRALLLSNDSLLISLQYNGVIVATDVSTAPTVPVPVTPSPITPRTPAPVLPATPPPTAPPTDAPVLPATPPPTAPPTNAPVLPATPSPTSLPTDAPVLPATQSPTFPPTDAPIVPATSPPTVPPTNAPIFPATPPPIVPPTDAPIVPPTRVPAVPPAAVPTTSALVSPQTTAPIIATTASPMAAVDTPQTSAPITSAPTISKPSTNDNPVTSVPVTISPMVTTAPVTAVPVTRLPMNNSVVPSTAMPTADDGSAPATSAPDIPSSAQPQEAVVGGIISGTPSARAATSLLLLLLGWSTAAAVLML